MGAKFEVDNNGNLTVTGNTTLKPTLTGVLQANAGVVSTANPVDVANGGTGATTFSNGVVHANGTNALSASAVDLSVEVSGQLPVANGGTGVSTLTGYVIGNGSSGMTASQTIPAANVTGLGSMASQNNSTVNITGGTVVGTNGNQFTIGDGTATGNKTIVANDSKSSKPAIQYNEDTSKWQYNNQDGSGWIDIGYGGGGGGSYIPQPVNPSANLTASGALYAATAGETLAAGDCCYLKSDGKFWKALATQTTTMPSVAIATTPISANATGTFLLSGLWRDDSRSYTVGALIYVDVYTAGQITATPPFALGQQTQILGYASSANVINFMPNLMLVAVATNDLGKGYCFGGVLSTSYTIGSWIDGLNLNTEVAVSNANSLATARADSGPGSSSTNIYLAGGQGQGGSYVAVTSVDKFSYSTTTSALTGNNLSKGGYCGGVAGSVAMYVFGQSNPQGSYQNLIQKITFATDAITTTSSVQSVARAYETGFSNSGFTKVYVTGGTGSSTGTSIDAITTSTDSCAAISAVLSDVRQQAQPYASSTYGYWAGGQNLSNYIATIDKLSFSNEARTTSSASLPAARAWGAGIRSTYAGYSCGGQTTANVSSIIRQLFSTDAVATLTATLAAGARQGLVGGSK